MFLAISFVSYGNSNHENPKSKENEKNKIIKLKEIVNPQAELPNNVKLKFNAKFNYWYIEIDTSCGPMVTGVFYCDCNSFEVSAMAMSLAYQANTEQCPLDEPGSQHIRLLCMC